MAVIFADTFTDTNGVSLDAHTPDTTPGGGWTEVVGNWGITSNAAVIAVSGNNSYATCNPGESDGIVTVSGYMGSTSTALSRLTGVVFRWQSAGNYWVAGFLLGTNTFYIAQFISGVPTVRASDATLSLTAGVYYEVEVTLSGDDISATIDGAHQITYNSAVGNTSTIHGFMGRDSASLAMDNFSFATVGGTDALSADNISAGAAVLGAPAIYDSADLVTFTDGTGGGVNTAIDLLMSAGWPTFNGGLHPDADIDPFNPQYTLFRFDLSSFASADTVITAKLHLFSTQGDEGAGVVSGDIYSVAISDSGWIEGTKNIALAGAGEPCWNAKEADGAGGVTTAWSGGDGRPEREASIIGSGSWLPSDADGVEHIIELDNDRIQDWLSATNTNYGIIIIPTGTNNAHVGMSENATAAYRPKLVVEVIVSTGGVDNLSADGIMSGAAIVGTSVLGQEHQLATSGLAAEPAITGMAVIAQIQVFTASNITSGAGIVNDAAIGQSHTLTASNLESTIVVSSVVIGQAHVLTAGNLESTAIIASAAIGQIHQLAGDALSAGAPLLGEPAIGAMGDLVSVPIVAGVPVLESPTLAQIFILQAIMIFAGSAIVGNPVLTQTGIPVYNQGRRFYYRAKTSGFSYRAKSSEFSYRERGH